MFKDGQRLDARDYWENSNADINILESRALLHSILTAYEINESRVFYIFLHSFVFGPEPVCIMHCAVLLLNTPFKFGHSSVIAGVSRSHNTFSPHPPPLVAVDAVHPQVCVPLPQSRVSPITYHLVMW